MIRISERDVTISENVGLFFGFLSKQCNIILVSSWSLELTELILILKDSLKPTQPTIYGTESPLNGTVPVNNSLLS